MPYFTVIIPTYNRAALLRSAVDSVLCQTFTDYELIVVDDGSTDSTPALLSELNGRVKAIRQDNAGPAAARNRGIEVARGQYCAFLDSDDMWFPWTLEKYREAIEKAGEPAGLIATPFHFSEPAELDFAPSSAQHVDRYGDYLEITERDFYRGSNVCAWKTSALRDVGGFINEKVFGEDIELFLRLGTAPGLAHIVSPPLVAVRRHAGGSLGNLDWHSAGARIMVRRERAGQYPGGAARKLQRLSSILSHCVLISLWCVEQRRYALGIGLYLRIFGWAVQRGRFKYLLGFPAAMIFPGLNPLRRAEARRMSNAPPAPSTMEAA